MADLHRMRNELWELRAQPPATQQGAARSLEWIAEQQQQLRRIRIELPAESSEHESVEALSQALDREERELMRLLDRPASHVVEDEYRATDALD